jgi:hypothetical protein
MILDEVKAQGKEHEVVGNWTVFDMLSHLAGWAVWRVKATKDLLNKRSMDYSHFYDNKGFNAKVAAERADHDWGEIVQEVRDADEKWFKLLDSLDHKEIFVSIQYRSPAWETLSDWVKIAYEHYIHHANILKNHFK